MNRVGLLWQITCVALLACFPMAHAREGISVQTQPSELGAALEIEATYFEFQLATHALAREKAELQALLGTGFAYEVSDAKERVTNRGRVAVAKRERLRAVTKEFSAHPSPWVKALAVNAAAVGSKRYLPKQSLPNRSLASVGEDFSERARALIETVAQRDFMVLLRWESLRDLVGIEAVNDFVRVRYGFRELGPTDPVPAALAPNPADLIVVGGSAEERKELAEAAEARGFLPRLFQPTAFTHLSERAQELRSFIAASPGPVTIVSFGEGATIVRSLIDQFSILRTDRSIRAWANVNGELYGKTFVGYELEDTQALPTRGLASAPDAALRARARTDIQLGLGDGFAITSLVNQDAFANGSVPLFHASYPGGNNYLFLNVTGSGPAAIEAIERALRP